MDKLPTIYLPLFSGEIDTSDDEAEMVRAFVRKADSLIEHTGEIAEYIPARRCRTCRFREAADNGCNHLLGMRSIPPDGSGFCHNHKGRT